MKDAFNIFPSSNQLYNSIVLPSLYVFNLIVLLLLGSYVLSLIGFMVAHFSLISKLQGKRCIILWFYATFRKRNS